MPRTIPDQELGRCRALAEVHQEIARCLCRAPARDHPADADAGRRPGPRNVAAGPADSERAAAAQEGAAARRVRALQLSR
jgi:hypothetical protein